MGGDLIEHTTGEFSRAVFIKGGSGNPLAFKATVTTYTDTTHFKTTDLIGYGDDYFGGPNNNWYVYAVRDSAGGGALPQGENELISNYVSSDGTFTHVAFTTPLAAGDEVLIVHAWAKAGGDATAANQTTIIADVTGLNGDAMRGTDSAALAATALTDVTWTNAKAAFLNAAIGDIPTTAMRGTDSAALASVCTEARLAHLTQDVTVGIKKGVARTIVFKMVDATDFATPETGITVVETISKDGGAFNACTNTFAEIANGWYKILLTATEMNANEIIFEGTSAGCAQCDRLIVTES